MDGQAIWRNLVQLARRIIAQGGALRSLDAQRLALGEAYTRYFEEEAHEA